MKSTRDTQSGPNLRKPVSRKHDPRYAAARPWDYKVCGHCGTLNRVLQATCQCGSQQFSEQPGDIIRVALRRYPVAA